MSQIKKTLGKKQAYMNKRMKRELNKNTFKKSIRKILGCY